MTIVSVKIHPAIGIARLGNSPTDFFIGPETTAVPLPPAGGYKDALCRIKRQAARFRLYAYDEVGTAVELNTSNAKITWTVSLANRKASSALANVLGGGLLRNNHALDRDKLNITQSGTLLGPSQMVKFNAGEITVWRTDGTSASATVDLGEARTDPESRLLVLGGFGKSASPTFRALNTGNVLDNDEWYDDISDGPVSANVQLLGTGETFLAEGAWVIVAPPKYAPPLINAITLWDKLFQFFVDEHLESEPTTTSFARDVYPILRSALDVEDVNAYANGNHKSHINPAEFPMSTLAAKRAKIFNALKSPLGAGGNMPKLFGGARLTKTQYEHMKRWKEGSFDNSWPVSSPVISPQELDRAALFHCVGAALAPGMEVSNFLTTSASNYTVAFRLNHSVVDAGQVTQGLSLPWQTDFAACDDRWWPSNRPNQVRTGVGGSVSLAWDRNHSGGPKMITDWPILGFVVDQGADRVEVERCDESFISLVTTQVLFLNVPQGPGGINTTTSRPIVFEIASVGSIVTLEFLSGATSGGLARYASGPFDFGPTAPGEILTARLWIKYTTGAVDSSVSDNVIVRHQQSGKTWTIPVEANTVARTTSKIVLALDRSGSMSEATSIGLTKLDLLKEAAGIFVDLAFEGDRVGATQFNQTATPIFAVATLGPPSDAVRTNLKNSLVGITAGGATSIGAGLEIAQSQLVNPPTFSRQALVVLTDGKENSPPSISDEADAIDAFTYAIGLGNANNVNVQILQALTGNRGGYLLLTGPLSGDNRFILTKYFSQILANINNQAIVSDPQGYLKFNETHRIPFLLTECDLLADIMLFSPFPQALQFELETPLGIRISPDLKLAGVKFIHAERVHYYRIRLPIAVFPDRLVQAGLWHAVVTLRENVDDTKREFPNRRLPYSLSVHTGSDLFLRATLHQDGFLPGAAIYVRAEITLFGIPLQSEAQIWAEVTQPDATTKLLRFNMSEPGIFDGKWSTVKPGVYAIRVRAKGTSPRGWHFEREQTVTGAVFLPEQQESQGHESSSRRMRRLAKREIEASERRTQQK